MNIHRWRKELPCGCVKQYEMDFDEERPPSVAVVEECFRCSVQKAVRKRRERRWKLIHLILQGGNLAVVCWLVYEIAKQAT